jgi:hypothetical protein
MRRHFTTSPRQPTPCRSICAGTPHRGDTVKRPLCDHLRPKHCGSSLLDMNLVGPVIAVRPYTHTSHYWHVYFETNETIIRVAREAGWPAPTPSQNIRQV